MRVRNAPISDYEGDEECVDVGGIVRDIDTVNQVLQVVDATGDFRFHFGDSWSAELNVGDYVHIRGIPRDAENEYTVVGVKKNPISNVSSWEHSEPNLAKWDSFGLLRFYDVLGWLSYERQVEETRHGREIYCLVELDGPVLNDVLGYVPETYVFNWEVDEDGDELTSLEQFAGSVVLEQLYENAKTFDS